MHDAGSIISCIITFADHSLLFIGVQYMGSLLCPFGLLLLIHHHGALVLSLQGDTFLS